MRGGHGLGAHARRTAGTAPTWGTGLLLRRGLALALTLAISLPLGLLCARRKDGIIDNLVKQCWDALEARELIKVTVLNTAPFETTRAACDELCERVHAEGVQVIGNRFCIYRQARENSRIRLEDL